MSRQPLSKKNMLTKRYQKWKQNKKTKSEKREKRGELIKQSAFYVVHNEKL